MLVTTSRQGPVLALRFEIDHIDVHNCRPIRQLLVEAVREESQVLVDVSSLAYVDWFGFECLLALVRECPGKVAFGGVSFGLGSLVRLHGLDLVLEHFESADAALDFLLQPSDPGASPPS